MPVFDIYVIVAEGSFRELNRNLLFLACFKINLFEAFKLSVGLIDFAFGRTNINLSNLCTGSVANILQLE